MMHFHTGSYGTSLLATLMQVRLTEPLTVLPALQ